MNCGIELDADDLEEHVETDFEDFEVEAATFKELSTKLKLKRNQTIKYYRRVQDVVFPPSGNPTQSSEEKNKAPSAGEEEPNKEKDVPGEEDKEKDVQMQRESKAPSAGDVERNKESELSKGVQMQHGSDTMDDADEDMDPDEDMDADEDIENGRSGNRKRKPSEDLKQPLAKVPRTSESGDSD